MHNIRTKCGERLNELKHTFGYGNFDWFSVVQIQQYDNILAVSFWPQLVNIVIDLLLDT